MTPYRIRVRRCDVLGRLVVCALLLSSAIGQQQQTRQQELQRAAMKKLAFLVGRWSGEGRWFTIHGILDLTETEDVSYEQDGLVLKIVGRGQDKADPKNVIAATSIVSYDDQSGTYRICGHANGHCLEGKLQIDDDWKGMAYDFQGDGLTTHTVLRMNQGYWTETHWFTPQSRSPHMFLLIAVRREKELRPRNLQSRGADSAK